MTKRETLPGSSYWDNTGAYQSEYDTLWKQMVPKSGSAETVNGELIRAVGRLFYEFCNNGNCNALDTEYVSCSHCGGSCEEFEGYDDDGDATYCDCSWCDGTGEDEGERFITEMYAGFLDFIEKHVPAAPVDAVRDFMLDTAKGYSNYKFNDAEMGVYNALTDAVMHHVLTTPDKKL